MTPQCSADNVQSVTGRYPIHKKSIRKFTLNEPNLTWSNYRKVDWLHKRNESSCSSSNSSTVAVCFSCSSNNVVPLCQFHHLKYVDLGLCTEGHLLCDNPTPAKALRKYLPV